jgi:hypothetical protein
LKLQGDKTPTTSRGKNRRFRSVCGRRQAVTIAEITRQKVFLQSALNILAKVPLN